MAAAGFQAVSELSCSEAVVTSNEDTKINFVLISELSACYPTPNFFSLSFVHALKS